jgi:hypothetical protein
MAKGYLPLPDGSYVTVRDDETPEQAFARARKEYPEAFEVERAPAKPKEGVFAAGLGGLKRAASQLQTAGEAAVLSPEEAARRGLERSEAIGAEFAPGASLEAVKQAYAERGLLGGAGEVVSQIPTALAEQFPQIAATLGSARAGAMAGQRIAGPRGALIGGGLGAIAPSVAQLFGSGLERQAAEGVEDISASKALAAAVPGAALEAAATFIPLGRTLIGKILGPEATKAMTRVTAEGRENLAKEGLAKVLAKGTATGALLEIPTEVIQQMLERAQAGLPLTSEDAYAEYGEAAYGAGLVGGPFGAVGRVGQRSVARGEIAEKEAAATAEEQRKAAEASRLEQEQAEAEEKTRLVSPEYRQELNSQIVDTKDRLREIENVLKDKTLDPDVKKEAIEEAKTLRKTIGDLNAKMKESVKASGQAPTLEQALAKQKEAVETEPGVVYDEYGLPVKTKTKPLTEAEEAAGYELQAARVTAEFEKRERDFQAMQEKNQQKELRRDKQLQEQLSGFIEGYDELQKQPYGPTEFVKSEREKQQAQEITLDRMQLALDKFTPRLLGLKPDETVTKLQAEYDRLSAPEAIAKTQSGASRTMAARENYMGILSNLENKLRTAYEKAAPNSRQGYDNALANGFVNRFVTSTLGIKGLGGRTLSFNDALPQVEARIAELEEQRQQAITNKDPLMSDKGQLTFAGEKLVVNEAKLNELKRIVEGAREQAPAETGAESAIAGTLKATTVAQAESPAVQVEQGLARVAYEAMIEKANKKATGSFDDLLSFVDDLQKKRFFGGAPGQIGLASSTEEGLQDKIKQAKSRVIDGLLEEVATTRVANKMRPLSTSEAYMFVEDVAGLVDMLVERSLAAAPGMQTETTTTPGQMRGTKLVEGATETEIDTRTERQLPFGATPRSQDIIAGMSEKDQQEFSESFDRLRKNVRDAKAKVTQIDDILNVMQPPKPVVKKGEAAPAPVQRRATLPESPEAQELADERVKAVDALRKAEQALADARVQIKNSVKGVSEKQAIQTIGNVIRSIKESTIAEGKRPVLASYATDLIGSRPRNTKKSDAQLDVEDRIIEDVGQILPTLDPDSEAFKTLDEAATTLANEDVSRDFVDLVGEQVQRIRQGTDEATDPQLLSDIRSALDAQRAGREFAQADDTMMVTQGKRFKEVETQPDLFPETRATTRATPGQFQRLQKSKEVQGKRKEIAAERIAKEKAEAELKQLERDLRAAKRNADVEATAALEKEEKNIFEEITKLAENIKRGMGDNISTTNAQKFAALDERIKKLVAEYRKKKPAVATSEVAENERILNKILKEADTPEPYNATQSNFTEAIAKTREAIERFEAKIKEANSALMEVANNPEVYEAKFKGLARYKKRGAAKARVEKLIEARTLFLEDAKKQLENFKLIARKTSVQPKVTVEKDKEESKIPDKELKAVRQALATRINATLRRLKEQDTKLTEDVRGFIGLGLNLPGTRYERKSREELAKEIGEARAEARKERKAAKAAGKTAEEISAIKAKMPSKFKIARIKDRSEILNEQRAAATRTRTGVSVVENLKAIEQQEATAVAALQKAKKDVKDWTKQIQEASTAVDQKLFKKYEPQFYAELDRLARVEEVAQTRLGTIRANKQMFSELRDVEYKTKPSPRERTTTGETKPAGLGVTEQQMYEYGVFGTAGGVKIKTNNPPEFAIGDSDPTGEIDVAEAKKFLADVKAKAAKQGIKVKVYPITEVMSPDLYGASLAALGPEAAKRVKGGVEPNGDVFFVIESHSTLEDLKATVAHELIGHYTFEGMLGEKGLKRLLNRLEKTYGNISKLAEKIGGQPLLRKVHQAEAMMQKLGKSDDEVRMRGLNELVAYTMEKRVDQDFLTRAKQWLQELVGALRLGLRELGIDMGGMSTSELFYLMRQADRNFKAGKPVARTNSDGVVEFSIGDGEVFKTGIGKMIAQRGTFHDKATAFATGMTGLAGRVKFLDRFAAIQETMKRGLSAGQITSLKAGNAMYFNRFADQRNNITANFATNGIGKIIVEDGEPRYGGNQGPSLKDMSETLATSGLPSKDAEYITTAYIAALRLQALKKQDPQAYKKLSTEGDITEADVGEIIRLYGSNPALQKIRQQYQQYNNNLIDFVVSTGAMEKAVGARLKDKDYVPFYRAQGDDVFLDIMGEKPIRIGDLKNQPYLHELMGGKEKILPIFTSALTNTAVLTDMALKNMATTSTVDALRELGIATVNKGKGPANRNVLRFKVDGQDFHAVIDTQAKADLFGDIPTELLVEGMEGIKGTLPVGVRLMGAPANWLRKFVTRDPRYAFRQIFRDSMAAAMTTGADFVPVVQTFKDMATMKKTGALKELQEAGVLGGQVISGSTDDMGKILLQISSGKPGWESAMARLDDLAMMGDAATRVSMYNSFLKQGLTKREAILATLEAMNFSRRGTSISVLYANTLIPFFNASLQGLDVLYRAFKGDMVASERLRVKQKLIARLGIMAGITLAYAAMMQDDESYENANPEERYGNWFVRIPGLEEPLRIPIPFELGLIGKALPEGIYRLMASDDSTKEVAKALQTLALRSIPIDVPTAVKPIIEWNLNRSFFTDRDLVTASMPNDPRFQYNLNTPEIIKLFGNIGLPPVKVENTLRGYTGGLGVSILRLLDPVFGGEVVKAGQGLANVPILGGVFQPQDASGIINAAYNTANNIEGINRTYKRLEVEDPDEADKYYDEKLDELSMASDAGRFKQYMGTLTKEEREIRADKTLDPKKKDEYLKEIRQEKIAASKEFRQLAAQM